MDDPETDPNWDLMLDGNAAAGLLQEMFAVEMTACPTACAWCGQHGQIGMLLAFAHAPGIVLRCPNCKNVMMRIVETNETIYFEASGVAFLAFERSAM
jgi:hypothetical protein